ncbi:MAG: ATP-binding cassette domain-containing protein [Deltaproteobacteria bacterium]|nr:MAG: ATP-binding cassette domain-containing protein [Deltaproteobacteria bacterium]
MKSLFQISNLSKRYGPKVIFDRAEVRIAAGEKIGVIGRNGAGKSTLFRMMTGEEEPDEGEIVRFPELRLAYLEQLDPFQPGERVIAFLERYTKRETWACGKVAARFQLGPEDLEAPIEALSGGYQMRVKLAAMLLREPNFLMLDEPTNYLDLHTLILLEKFLADYRGGFLIISHDREFLKRTCNETLEIENGKITLYPGDIEAYLAWKAERREQRLRQNENVEKKRRQLQAFVDRFRAKSSKARQAQSKLKQIARLQKIEIEQASPDVSIRIPPVTVRKGVALSCEALAIGYPTKRVAEGIDLVIERGRHVAILGDNGEGKTTLMKTLAGVLEPLSGSYTWGKTLEIGYFAQHTTEMLDPADTVERYLYKVAPSDVTRQEIRDMAGAFLFRGEEVEKEVRVLSGGERARLCLAGLLLSRRDVLLLDEPTNHLDFETVEALGTALRDFAGTVFFISHDRTFVHLLADTIVEIRGGRVLAHPGTYDDYVYHLECLLEEELSRLSPPEEKRDGKGREKPSSGSAKPKSAYHERKAIKSRITKLQTQRTALEGEIERLSQEKERLLQEILDDPTRYDPERQGRLDAVSSELEAAEGRWISIEEEIETLRNTLEAAS